MLCQYLEKSAKGDEVTFIDLVQCHKGSIQIESVFTREETSTLNGDTCTFLWPSPSQPLALESSTQATPRRAHADGATLTFRVLQEPHPGAGA